MVGAQQIELGIGLDAFGNHVDAEAVGQGNGRNGNRRVVGVTPDVGDEGAVDFQVVDREKLEIGKRGIARAKIVDCQGDAHFLESFEYQARFFRLFHDRAFGDLDFQQMRRQPGFA